MRRVLRLVILAWVLCPFTAFSAFGQTSAATTELERLTTLSAALAPAADDPMPDGHKEARARLLGLGQGIAAGAIGFGRPTAARRPEPPFSGLIRSSRGRDVRAEVIMVDAHTAGLPLSVEVRSGPALRRLAKPLHEMTPEALKANFGPPDLQTADVWFYDLYREACEEGVELVVSARAVVGARWRFCVD